MFKHDYSRYETVIRPRTYFTNEEFKIALNFSPKTASSSIKALLIEGNFQNFVSDATSLSNYKVFAVLREPFSRFISSYAEVLKFRPDVFIHTKGYEDFTFRYISDPYERLETFIYESYERGLLDQHLFPQDYYLNFDCIDTLIDFDNLETELYTFLQTVSCYNKLAWKNRTLLPNTNALLIYLISHKRPSSIISEIYAADLTHYENLQKRKQT